MERQAVLEFLVTLSPKELLDMVVDVARLRDGQQDTAAESTGVPDAGEATVSDPSARRERSSRAVERQAQRDAESRAAVAAAVNRNAVPLFAKCQLRCGKPCSTIRLKATDAASADLFKAASDAILDDLGRRNPGWANKVKGTAHQIFLVADGEAKSTAVFSQCADGSDIVVHLMATAPPCQRKGFATAVLKVLQAYVNGHKIFVEVSGTEIPAWWRNKGFKLEERVSVKPKLWRKSKVMCWSREHEDSHVQLLNDPMIYPARSTSAATKVRAAHSAAVIPSCTAAKDSSAALTGSLPSWKSRAGASLEDHESLTSPTPAPSPSSAPAAVRLHYESSRRSLLFGSPTGAHTKRQQRESTSPSRRSDGPGCPPQGAGCGAGCGDMTPLHVLRKQRETSPEFFDSWADERMLIGRKTREHIGIHVAKENETPRMIAKQLNIEPPELLLQLNADWYPELQLSDKFKASTKLMYETTGLDRVLEGTVLGQVDPDGYTSPFWRVEYPALASSSDDGESFVLERTLKEVWDGCWAWEAHADDWKLSGNPHIGQRVAKAVDNETRMEIQIEVAAEEQDDTPDRDAIFVQISIRLNQEITAAEVLMLPALRLSVGSG